MSRTQQNLVPNQPEAKVETKGSLQSADLAAHAAVQDLLHTLEDLQTAQKQLRYFTKEVKLWASPQRRL